MFKCFFILGPKNEEMDLIEALLEENNLPYGYAASVYQLSNEISALKRIETFSADHTDIIFNKTEHQAYHHNEIIVKNGKHQLIYLGIVPPILSPGVGIKRKTLLGHNSIWYKNTVLARLLSFLESEYIDVTFSDTEVTIDNFLTSWFIPLVSANFGINGYKFNLGFISKDDYFLYRMKKFSEGDGVGILILKGLKEIQTLDSNNFSAIGNEVSAYMQSLNPYKGR